MGRLNLVPGSLRGALKRLGWSPGKDPGTGRIAEPPFPAERLRGVRTEGCAGNGLENLEPREWWGELMEAEAFQGQPERSTLGTGT